MWVSVEPHRRRSWTAQPIRECSFPETQEFSARGETQQQWQVLVSDRCGAAATPPIQIVSVIAPLSSRSEHPTSAYPNLGSATQGDPRLIRQVDGPSEALNSTIAIRPLSTWTRSQSLLAFHESACGNSQGQEISPNSLGNCSPIMLAPPHSGHAPRASGLEAPTATREAVQRPAKGFSSFHPQLPFGRSFPPSTAFARENLSRPTKVVAEHKSFLLLRQFQSWMWCGTLGSCD